MRASPAHEFQWRLLVARASFAKATIATKEVQMLHLHGTCALQKSSTRTLAASTEVSGLKVLASTRASNVPAHVCRQCREAHGGRGLPNRKPRIAQEDLTELKLNSSTPSGASRNCRLCSDSERGTDGSQVSLFKFSRVSISHLCLCVNHFDC
jgi:hypothetical protein